MEVVSVSSRHQKGHDPPYANVTSWILGQKALRRRSSTRGSLRQTNFGHTILYGEGGQYLDQIGPAALNLGITSSDFSYWGLGAVQEIDSAAMSIWLKYRKHQAAVSGGGIGKLDDIDFVAVGSIINF